MERRNAKGPAVNLSTSSPLPPPSPSFRSGDLLVQKDHSYVHSRNSLCQALSHRTTPSYGHHPQFAFLKGAQKPPEIAAGSSDVTAGSISVPLDRSTLPPPPLSPSSLLFLRSVRVCLSFSSRFFFIYLPSSTIDDFTSRYLPRRQEF